MSCHKAEEEKIEYCSFSNSLILGSNSWRSFEVPKSPSNFHSGVFSRLNFQHNQQGLRYSQ